MGLEKQRELNIIKNVHIKHHSYVDIIGLLKALPVWFNKMGYYFYEKGLAEKDIGTGDKVESKWTATRDVTEYIRYVFEVSVVAQDIRKIVLESGEEIYWARVLIIINATFVKDFQNKYTQTWYGEFMRQVYERYIGKDELKKFIGKLIIESTDLVETLKSYLK